MQIELSKIKSSSQPIRTTQDKESLDGLAQSIKEQGLLQAVKLRPVGDQYEVVFGHRRVEASRQAGLTSIEAVVEDLDDSTALIQALVENVVREDLGSLDKARGLKALKDATGWSNKEMGRRGIMSTNSIGRLLALLEEPEEVKQLLTKSQLGVPRRNPLHSITAKHVELVRPVGLPEEDKVKILQKAASEGLTASQTRQVADALKRTQDPRAREWLLEIPTADVPIVEAVSRDIAEGERDEERDWWSFQAGDGAKNLIRRIRLDREGWKHAWLIVERGAIGPEHMPYLEKRLRNFGRYILSLADDLDARRKEAINGS